MSIEHSPARQKKSGIATLEPTSPALEPLYTREELAARWRVQPQHITRHYKKMGLKPVEVSKRKLFPESQILKVESKSISA